MYTAVEIIKSAFRKLSAYSSGDTLDPDMASDALNTLQDLLSGWYAQGILDYVTEVSEIVLIPTTAEYTILTKTYDIVSMVVRDSGNQDYSVSPISELNYERITDKASPGRPARFVIKQSLDSSKTITLWPVPDTADTLRVVLKIMSMDFTGLYTVSTLPTEFNKALIWNLAAELWVEYPNPDVQQIVFGKAEKSLLAVIDAMGSQKLSAVSTDILHEGGYYNIDCDCMV